jgi:zinc/manganese transport system substrate-binding protein
MEKSVACTIFTDIAANDSLAKTVASELSGCDEVKIVPLYTGSLGPDGSGAESYIGMLKVNLDRIVEGLE